MGLLDRFKKGFEPRDCLICDEAFVPEQSGMLHWETHVLVVPPGSSQYTWKCTCGPSPKWWPDSFSAASALAIHMYRVHNVPLESFMADEWFLRTLEQKLGLR